MKSQIVFKLGIVGCLIVLSAGCASTKVTSRDQIVTGRLPKPTVIWVYDFAATAADLPANSAAASEQDVDKEAQQTPEEIALGRELGAEIASQLIAEINKMGMTASHGVKDTVPQLNDIVIRGTLLSVNKGNAAARVIIGFGAGGSEMRTMVEGFQMTNQGLRKLGVGSIDSGGSKGPGAALGVATFLATANPAGLIISSGMKVYGEASGKSTIKGRAEATAKEIGKVLKTRFQEQTWIPMD